MRMAKQMICLVAICFFLIIIPTAGKAADAYIRADVLSLSTNAVASGSLNLGSVSPGDGYYLFPYYLRFEFPETNYTAWGIQMYTNNNPNKTWLSSNGLYSGLRSQTDPTMGIPLKWQVYNDLQNVESTWDTPQSITMTAGGLGFYDYTQSYWGRLFDVNDDDVDQDWMSSSVLLRRTIASYQGLGDSPGTGRLTANSPIYVYLGMDLNNVTFSDDYRTTLRVDLYNLGVDITQGGFATPNPFTPTTGQRASFNFFLKDINSSFIINIYTIRGRKIRTITDTRAWDGRNNGGQMVEGGLYIYQIEAEGKRVSGTVVLIK